jgi:arylsulfatase A-like enzyme/HEAT repeat protein
VSAVRFLIGGGALAAIEVGLVLLLRRGLFLSAAELWRYALLAFSALPALCALLGIAGSQALRWLRVVTGDRRRFTRALRGAVFALAAPACGGLFWALSAGRRVRALPGRPFVIALLSLVAAASLALIASRLVAAHERRGASPPYAAALLALAGAAVAADMLVLTRLYPAFHLGLGVSAWIAATCAAPFLSLPVAREGHGTRRADTLAWAATLLCVAGGSWASRSLAAAPNARFAIAQSAPLSARLLPSRRPSAIAAAAARSAGAVPPPSPRGPSQPSVDLRGSDVLLITVDALRADRLRAYGGRGLTPAIDALAAESAVFARAYTPTPHTSYALSSLFTAKFMQPLLSLAEVDDDQPTLPQLLRNHGYRTAAFYPPAIFYVDGERFQHLKDEQLGFEYVKAMYAPAEDRVAQLEAYLREVTPGHPLLVWIHLFEPHEPYDPPPAFARGDTPVERYDGEVAAADAAVGRLVSTFRRARPGATVILSADHGEEFGDHGGHHHGTALYEEHVHVPLLWSSPGRVPPHRVRAPVEILDVTTTLLAALGIPREARMRGDDLGALLAGASEAGELRAFSSIDGARMFTDGTRKLICSDDECRLFDLARDPGERRDVADEQAAAAGRLRGELNAFVASLPRIEALAMQGGGAWPDALARARLGDAAAGPLLLPLLSSPRADVRAAAARSLGELGSAPARDALAALRANDADVLVRAEAAIAALRLDDAAAVDQVAALLGQAPPGAPADLTRRAAQSLALHGDGRGDGVLLRAATDTGLDELERIAAIRALAASGGKDTSSALTPLLAEVRLRRDIAAALARLKDPRACGALEATLAEERNPEARTAEVRALLALGARAQALAALRRFLGTDSALPDGVALLAEAGALALAGGADVRTSAAVRRGAWQCEARGCRPLEGAALRLRAAPAGAARVTVRASVDGVSRLLRLGDRALYLNGGAVEVAVRLERARGRDLAIRAEPGIWIEAFAAVPPAADVPPPPPEPWAQAQAEPQAQASPPSASSASAGQ